MREFLKLQKKLQPLFYVQNISSADLKIFEKYADTRINLNRRPLLYSYDDIKIIY